MSEYAVTGVRYQMGDDLSYEEQTAAAERFVSGLAKGCQVTLVAEPENPFDGHAIAVYKDFVRVGYIGREETAEVRPLLGDNGQCDGVVVDNDGHVTFFVSIPDADESQVNSEPRKRVLPESPLGDTVRMPFRRSESQFQMISRRLMSIELTPENVAAILSAIEHFVPLMVPSICHEDNYWMRGVQKMLRRMCTTADELGLNSEQKAQVFIFYNNVRAKVGDLHRSKSHVVEQMFVHHLDLLREDDSVSSHLYRKFCDAFLDGKSFEGANRRLLVDAYKKLKSWLKGLKWSELRNPDDLETMALKVSYLRLSRQELYELYSVLLLLERLESLVGDDADEDNQIVERLLPIFYEEEDDAREFLNDIRGMKPTEITHHVRELVKGGTISDLSYHRDLWQVLHDYGLYDKSESNWNQQVGKD